MAKAHQLRRAPRRERGDTVERDATQASRTMPSIS
jgi:hypothetical protein